MQIVEQFRQAMAGAGITPPDVIHADGLLHRFTTNGKRSDAAGWYCLHGDNLPAGAFGDWRQGMTQTWCSKDSATMTQEEREAYRQRMQQIQAQRDAEQAQNRAEAKVRAQQQWDAASQSVSHPYLINKGVQGYGLRQKDNLLLVPLCDEHGQMHSLQTIDKGGEKRFLAGGRVNGCFHIIGKPEGRIVVCEGFATGASIHAATDLSVACAMNAGNLQAVAKALRAKHKGVQIVIAADDDSTTDGNPGVTKARAAAELVGGEVVVPLFGDDRPERATDFNDLYRLKGPQAVKALFLREAPKLENRFKLLSGRDIANLPPLRWLVRGVLPADGVAALYGPSGSGKSFLALDMAAAIAEGNEWFGCRVTAAPVVYCALEGEAGFSARVQAWEKHNECDLPDDLNLMLQPFKLTEPADVCDLASVVPHGAVVFIDTLNRAAPTMDENSSADMGTIIEAAKRLQAITGGLVCLVHHTGKDTSKGLRGHSSLHAALDAAIEVTRDGERRAWSVAKSKDGQDGIDHRFGLKVKTVGSDEYGDDITSCAVEQVANAGELTRPKVPKGGNQRIIYNGLGDLLRKSHHFGKNGAPPTRPCVELEEAVEALATKLVCEPVRRKERARQAMVGLINGGAIACSDGWIWLS